MKRIKLTLEYDGTPFNGWQRQKEAHTCTVQGELEAAIKAITREDVTVQAAGRTDRGVHALGQVCHFDLESAHAQRLPLIRFKDGINKLTPPEMMVTQVEVVDESFQARFLAEARTYKFLLFNRRADSPLMRNRAVHIIQPLDVDAMRRAAAPFKGELLCEAFRSTECQAQHARCFWHHLNIVERDDHVIEIHLKANRFLHNMVRILVGTLVDVGRGKLDEDVLARMLETHERSLGGGTLPPYGLYFMQVDYPEHTIYESC